MGNDTGDFNRVRYLKAYLGNLYCKLDKLKDIKAQLGKYRDTSFCFVGEVKECKQIAAWYLLAQGKYSPFRYMTTAEMYKLLQDKEEREFQCYDSMDRILIITQLHEVSTLNYCSQLVQMNMTERHDRGRRTLFLTVGGPEGVVEGIEEFGIPVIRGLTGKVKKTKKKGGDQLIT